MSWAQIQARLTDLMQKLPMPASFHTDPCAGKILRLREIGEWCGIHHTRMYDIRLGTRSHLLKPELQRKLSKFFADWDSGKLVKAKIDGKWRISHFDPKSEVPADAPHERPKGSIAAQISWAKGTLRVKPR